MIARLTGKIAAKKPGKVILDVGGVGYLVFIPLSTFYKLEEPGSTATLRIHTYVREDTLTLYGFHTALEKNMFERLISISGIGPSMSLDESPYCAPYASG